MIRQKMEKRTMLVQCFWIPRAIRRRSGPILGLRRHLIASFPMPPQTDRRPHPQRRLLLLLRLRRRLQSRHRLPRMLERFAGQQVVDGTDFFDVAFPMTPSPTRPSKVATNEQLGHLRVMRVRHRDQLSVQTVTRGELVKFVGVVVSHQEIACDSGS